jgi:cysteine-rich repeat protein
MKNPQVIALLAAGLGSAACEPDPCAFGNLCCGDGQVQRASGEVCDDGNQLDGDHCSWDCRRKTGSCGDGELQDNEACDDGPLNADGWALQARCRTDCMALAPHCGDGEVDEAAGELCDDGGPSPTCAANCRVAPAVTAGEAHTCALSDAGVVFCWGDDGLDQLGRGSDESPERGSEQVAAQVSGLPDAVRALDAGAYHSCAVTLGGRVFCWGWNGHGQLGRGEDVFVLRSADPAPVLDLEGSAHTVAAGGAHSCAVVEGGQALCWGSDSRGQLGDGEPGGAHPRPVSVLGLDAGVQAVAAGGHHTCALLVSGGVMCWGADDRCQLGDGACLDDRAGRGDVLGLTAGVVQIAAGRDHSCALRVDGTVWCWGANVFGQLGVDGHDDQTVAAPVPGLPGPVRAIAAGTWHSCAVLDDGAVTCWGADEVGQLGDGGGPAEQSLPTAVIGLQEPALAIAAGGGHSCAVLADASLRCWGAAGQGQLGFRSSSGRSEDRVWSVPGLSLGAPAVALTAGRAHVCVLDDQGRLKCWGADESGQLGAGDDAVAVLGPSQVAGQWRPAPTAAIAAGGWHTCAVSVDEDVICWGSNRYGQLGTGATGEDRLPPTPVQGLGGAVATLAAGGPHTCALSGAGDLWCWGSNVSGQLGDGGNVARRGHAAPVLGLADAVKDVVAGAAHSCALIASGVVQCWGAGKHGQLGDGQSEANVTKPVAVVDLSGVTGLAAGAMHTCAVHDTGAVSCWGSNNRGQLGAIPQSSDGNDLDETMVRTDNLDAFDELADRGGGTDQSRPVRVQGLAGSAKLVVAGSFHTCALLGSGHVQCWGANDQGQLGAGSGVGRDASEPVDVVGLPNGVRTLAAGAGFTCALREAGDVVCWGARGNCEVSNAACLEDGPVRVQVMP